MQNRGRHKGLCCLQRIGFDTPNKHWLGLANLGLRKEQNRREQGQERLFELRGNGQELKRIPSLQGRWSRPALFPWVNLPWTAGRLCLDRARGRGPGVKNGQLIQGCGPIRSGKEFGDKGVAGGKQCDLFFDQIVLVLLKESVGGVDYGLDKVLHLELVGLAGLRAGQVWTAAKGGIQLQAQSFGGGLGKGTLFVEKREDALAGQQGPT